MGYFDYKSSKAFINSLKATSSMYKAGDQFDQQGSFVSTRFRNDDTNFVIGTFQPDNITLEPIVCKGTVYNYMEGVPYRVKGKVVDDRTYGIQVSVSNVQAVKPSNKAQIIAFLSSGLFSGIGPATAARIYDAFGDDTMSVLENDPDKLATVKGLSKKKVDAYKEVIPRVLRFQEIVGELGALGLTMTTIKHIIDKYGDNALGIIKNNPYVLTKIRGFGFTRADQIARKFGIGIGDPRRIMYGTYYTLDWACKNYGHTLMPEEELRVELLLIVELLLFVLMVCSTIFHPSAILFSPETSVDWKSLLFTLAVVAVLFLLGYWRLWPRIRHRFSKKKRSGDIPASSASSN